MTSARKGCRRAAGAAAWLLGSWILVPGGPTVSAQGISRDEALRGAYPEAEIRPEQLFLTAAQVEQGHLRTPEFVEDRTVDVHIRRLRQALTASGHEELIQTVRGVGYRFSAK